MEFVIFLYIGLGGFGILVGIVTYILLKKNSRVYICESCGEVSKFEQMKAKSCSVCGGKLIEVKRKDVNFFKQEHKISLK